MAQNPNKKEELKDVYKFDMTHRHLLEAYQIGLLLCANMKKDGEGEEGKDEGEKGGKDKGWGGKKDSTPAHTLSKDNALALSLLSKGVLKALSGWRKNTIKDPFIVPDTPSLPPSLPPSLLPFSHLQASVPHALLPAVLALELLRRCVEIEVERTNFLQTLGTAGMREHNIHRHTRALAERTSTLTLDSAVTDLTSIGGTAAGFDDLYYLNIGMPFKNTIKTPNHSPADTLQSLLNLQRSIRIDPSSLPMSVNLSTVPSLPTSLTSMKDVHQVNMHILASFSHPLTCSLTHSLAHTPNLHILKRVIHTGMDNSHASAIQFKCMGHKVSCRHRCSNSSCWC
jgi:hypothetical protein